MYEYVSSTCEQTVGSCHVDTETLVQASVRTASTRNYCANSPVPRKIVLPSPMHDYTVQVRPAASATYVNLLT